MRREVIRLLYTESDTGSSPVPGTRAARRSQPQYESQGTAVNPWASNSTILVIGIPEQTGHRFFSECGAVW